MRSRFRDTTSLVRQPGSCRSASKLERLTLRTDVNTPGIRATTSLGYHTDRSRADNPSHPHATDRSLASTTPRYRPARKPTSVEPFRFSETVSHFGAQFMLFLLLIVWLAHSPVALAAGRVMMILAIIGTIAFATNSTTAIADDRYERSRGPAALKPARSKQHNAERLREGTLVPPTVGRIVMLGRRWAFIPDGQPAQTGDDVVQFDRGHAVASMVGFTRKPRPTRLGTATPTAAAASDSMIGATLVTTHASNGNTFQTTLPQVLVVENLMLQRIAEAIRADGSDDRWTVSGEVTEFFNENQLLIRTAQRAASR